MTIGENIRNIRKSKGLTMKDIANKLDMTEQAISQYERNIRTPNTKLILKIADILNVSPQQIDAELTIWDEFDARTNADKLIKEIKEIEESNKIKKEILENGDLDHNKIKWILEDQENLIKKCDKIVKGMEDFKNTIILFNSKEKEIISELTKIYNSVVFEKAYDVNKLNDEQYNKLKQNIRNSIKESFEEFENK